MFCLKPPTTSVHGYPLPSSTFDYPSHADVCNLSSFYGTHQLKHDSRRRRRRGRRRRRRRERGRGGGGEREEEEEEEEEGEREKEEEEKRKEQDKREEEGREEGVRIHVQPHIDTSFNTFPLARPHSLPCLLPLV